MSDNWRLLEEMRRAYLAGENASLRGYEVIQDGNTGLDRRLVIEYAYELQAGTYIDLDLNSAGARGQEARDQVVKELSPWLDGASTVLEIGVGEGTTLKRVLQAHANLKGFGLDISYSRVSHARAFLASESFQAELFVADLMRIPLKDDSVDVVYSNHSIEPNSGWEEVALRECLRVARNYVVLFEPSYEHANDSSRKRMKALNYIQGLEAAVVRVHGQPLTSKLVENPENPDNPTALTVLSVHGLSESRVSSEGSQSRDVWQCPLSGEALTRGDFFYAAEAGLAFPSLDGIPLLRPEQGIVCLNPAFISFN